MNTEQTEPPDLIASQWSAKAGDGVSWPAAYIFTLLLLAFSLWDVYLDLGTGVRVFDLVGVLLLAGLLCSGQDWRRAHTLIGDQVLPLVLLLLLVAFYVMLGVTSNAQNLKAGLGFLLGVTVMLMIMVLPVSDREITYAIGVPLVFHVTLAYVQYGYLILFDVYLDPFEMLDTQSRVFAETIRISGLFLEPAHLALTCIALVIIYVERKSVRSVDPILMIALGGVVVSGSLWGVVVGPVALLLWLDLRRPINLVFPILLGGAALWAYHSGQFDNLYLTERLANIQDDKSANVRYGGLVALFERVAYDPLAWTGNGIGWDFLEYGENGLSSILYGAGLIGSTLLITSIVSLGGRRDLTRKVLSILMLLTATPMWGQMFFWAWLGLLARRQH